MKRVLKGLLSLYYHYLAGGAGILRYLCRTIFARQAHQSALRQKKLGSNWQYNLPLRHRRGGPPYARTVTLW